MALPTRSIPAAPSPARARPEPEADHDRDGLAEPDQEDRRTRRVDHDLDHRLAAILDRVAEVALRRRSDVGDQLVGEQGLVEAPLGRFGGDDLRREMRVLRRALRRAGHHPEQDEVEDHDRHDRDERPDQLARDVATAHPSRLPVVRRGPRDRDPRRRRCMTPLLVLDGPRLASAGPQEPTDHHHDGDHDDGKEEGRVRPSAARATNPCRCPCSARWSARRAPPVHRRRPTAPAPRASPRAGPWHP